MAPPRFVAALNTTDAVKAAPARDPAAWRQQVAAELEQLIAPPPRPAPNPPATEFPDLRRPVPPARRVAKRSRGGAGVLALVVATGLAGVVVGAALPSGFRLQDIQNLQTLKTLPNLQALRDRLPGARRAPVILAEARLEPLRTPPLTVNTAPIATAPSVAAAVPPAALSAPPVPAVPVAAPPAGAAASASQLKPAVAATRRSPRQRGTAFADGGYIDPMSDEEVILEAAYREAAQAGVPQALIRANRAEWRVVRAGAAKQSTNALLDAYEARIEEVHTLADEAWRAQNVAEQDGGAPARP